MHWFKFRLNSILLGLLMVGCAGTGRSCSNWGAQNFGADWVIVQTDLNGRAFRCWKLSNVSVSNESQSDGIYWKSSKGHLVHLSGQYNRVQVESDDWKGALAEVGLTEAECEAISTKAVK